MAKVAHKEFSLASTAGRVALLVGVTAGTVSRTEVEAAVLRDTEKRPYRKPVFIFGRRFASITAAAEYSVGPHASAKSLKAEQVQIQKWCNADNVEGVYWSN